TCPMAHGPAAMACRKRCPAAISRKCAILSCARCNSMGRRSDHSRPELREMIITEGHRQISEVGFMRFSAREVAKRIGYSIGTIYIVFGSYVQLILAINGRTLDVWVADLNERLEGSGGDRLRTEIDAYFTFAFNLRHAWAA